MFTQNQKNDMLRLKAQTKKAEGGLYRNNRGDLNAVARVQATPSGRKRVVDGNEVGVKGRDGRKNYVIREATHGVHATGMDLYCSCPAQKYHVGFGKPCKHIEMLLEQFSWMREEGVTKTNVVSLYDDEAIERAICALEAAQSVA